MDAYRGNKTPLNQAFVTHHDLSKDREHLSI